MKFKKILLIHTWGIGDLIMFTPVLKILRKNFRRSQIDVFVDQPIVGEVLQENQTVNKILRFTWRKNTFFQKVKFIFKLRKEKYDISIVSTGINPWRAGLFSFLIGAKIRIGEYRKNRIPFYTHQITADKNQHKINSNLNLIKLLGIKIKNVPLPFFEFGKTEKDFVEAFIKGINPKNKILIGFHPGAGEKQLFKTWDKHNFVTLGQKIIEKYKDVCIIVIGGPKEKKTCERIKAKIKKNTFLATSFTLKQVAALIDNCNIFISSDSGIGHIASTTKTNLIAIFGPTNPKRTGPTGPRVRIIREKCDRPYNDLINPRYNTKKIHKCLKKITPERVFSEITKILLKK